VPGEELMANCIRCDEKVPLGSRATCQRAPDGGCHEFLPHFFLKSRLDGMCSVVDPDFGTTCGHPKDTETSLYDPSSVFHICDFPNWNPTTGKFE
jgi:hypothetical protein